MFEVLDAQYIITGWQLTTYITVGAIGGTFLSNLVFLLSR